MKIPNIKSLDKPFEITPFQTEWDRTLSDVIKPAPFINAKFGNRPMLTPLGPPLMDPLGYTGWWNWNKSMLDETVKNNSVLYLLYGSVDSHIKQLYQACADTGQPRLIVTHDKIRSAVPVPANVRVIHTNAMAYQFSKLVSDDSNIRPVFRRSVADLKHSFLFMAANPNSDRIKVLMMLESLGVLENALCSSPDVEVRSKQYITDNIAINQHLNHLHSKYLGSDYSKFGLKGNLRTISDLLSQCHFHVAMDSDVLYTHYIHWCVGEKHLQGFTATTPVLPIWDDPETQTMKEWGFRFNNIPSRDESESEQEAVMRWCKEILFYYQMIGNKEWAQSWQNQQGEDTFHNFTLLKGLHRTISSNIERQIDELPTEFQNL